MSDTSDLLPVISEIRLCNFKSVQQQTVQLAPLTVIVGANSSGKSTLIQGLLLLCQTIRARSLATEVPLNGDLVSLGYFDKAKRLGAQASDSVGIGLAFKFRPDGRYGGVWYDEYVQTNDDPTDPPWSASVYVEFGAANKKEAIAAPLIALELAVEAESRGDLGKLRLQRRRRAARTPSDYSTLMLPRSGVPTTEFVGSLTEGLPPASSTTKINSLSLRGLMPADLYTSFREPAGLARVFFGSLGRFFGYVDSLGGSSDREGDEQLLRGAADLLSEWRTGKGDSITLDRHLRASIFNRDGAERFLPLLNRAERNERRLARLLAPGDGHTIDVKVRNRAASTMSVATEGLRQILSSLEHLGGLRAAPQPLYATSNQAATGHLGREGQYTAAVLHALKNRPISSFDEQGNRRQETLGVAVQAWAQRLGILEEVDPHHRGAMGLDISVKQVGLTSELDITAVGVGVSQLLPVIVRCLLSGPGEVVLLEQPELHLHPRSQQLLADFLLACVRSGRQLVVETHSEHLVNRLRRRVAENGTPDGARLISLVFAERDAENGLTKYRNVEVNQFGGLDSWPEGFMAEGLEDARALLASGLLKLEDMVTSDSASPA